MRSMARTTAGDGSIFILIASLVLFVVFWATMIQPAQGQTNWQHGQKVDPDNNPNFRHVEIQIINDGPAARAIVARCNGRAECYWKPLFRASRTPGSGVTAHLAGGNVTVFLKHVNTNADVTQAAMLTSGDIFKGRVLVRTIPKEQAAEVNVPILPADQGGKGTGILVLPEAFFAGKDTLVCLRSEDIQIQQPKPVTKGPLAGRNDVECDHYDANATGFTRYFAANPRNRGYMFTLFRKQ